MTKQEKEIKYWTTADGEKIKYEDLGDGHLKNIIKDGYRNPWILEEAKARKFKVPIRPIDALSLEDHMMWIEAFSSCAIVGNERAKEMVDLCINDKPLYFLMLNQMLLKYQND